MQNVLFFPWQAFIENNFHEEIAKRCDENIWNNRTLAIVVFLFKDIFSKIRIQLNQYELFDLQIESNWV